jgi:hypothetical protein
MIRQAMRQPPLDREDPAGQKRLQAKRGKPGEQSNRNKQQEPDARGNGPSDQRQRLPQGNAATPPQPPAENAEGGRGTNRGGGGGQGTGGIYGAQGPTLGQEPASRKFELKLTLQGQSSGATMEPQRSQRGGVNDLGIPADQPTTGAPLNPNQRADEPLVRGEIPAEHETMIKRIFSRSE